MNAWAGIESAAENPRGPAADATPAREPDAVAVPSRRLRRQQRPVLGSIDAAGVLLQRTTRLIVLGSAAIVLPAVVLNLIASGMAFERYQDFSGSLASGPELFGAGRAANGIESVLWYLAAIISSLSACLVGGYVTTLVVQRQLGRRLAAGTALRALARRLPALVVAWIVGHSWFVLAAWLIGHATGWSAPLLVLTAPLAFLAIVCTAVVAPAIIVEGLGPFAGLMRSWRLTRRRFALVSVFVFASALVGVFVQYGITVLPQAFDAVGLLSFGRFTWLAQGVTAQLGRLISVPLVATATAFIYLEVRMDAEGMDLTLEAQRCFPPR